MNKPTFTKGPWVARKLVVGRYVICQEETGEYICGTSLREQGVRKQAEPNATLIAVAPEMYDFIQFFETIAGQAYLLILPDKAGEKIYEEAVRLCKKARGEK